MREDSGSRGQGSKFAGPQEFHGLRLELLGISFTGLVGHHLDFRLDGPKCWLTSGIGPEKESFFGQTETQMIAALKPVEETFRPHPSYTGLAFFHYEAYKVMP